MRKTLVLVSALMIAASSAFAAEPVEKKVCHKRHGKEHCHMVKIHSNHVKK
jgi:hypothetical protein